MDVGTLTGTLELKDSMSGVLKQAADQVQSFGKTVDQASSAVVTSTSKMESSITSLGNTAGTTGAGGLQLFNDKLETLVNKLSGAEAQKGADDLQKAFQILSERGQLSAQAMQNVGEAAERLQKQGATLSGDLSNVVQGLHGTTEASSLADTALTTLAEGFGAIVGGAIAAVFSLEKLAQFLSESVSQASNAEMAQVKLTSALKAQNEATPYTIDYMDQLAESYAKTTLYTEDQIKATEAMLTQIGGVLPAQMDKALEATTNLAAGMGVDLETAARRMGQAAEGNIGQLKRYVPALDEARAKAEGLSYILDEVAKKFSGDASAQVDTYKGSMVQLSKAWEDLEIQVGNFIVKNPAVITALKDVAGAVDLVGTAVHKLNSLWELNNALSPSGMVRNIDAARIQVEQDAKDKAANDARRHDIVLPSVLSANFALQQNMESDAIILHANANEKLSQSTLDLIEKYREEGVTLTKMADVWLAHKYITQNQADLIKQLGKDYDEQAKAAKKASDEAERLAEAHAKFIQDLEDKASGENFVKAYNDMSEVMEKMIKDGKTPLNTQLIAWNKTAEQYISLGKPLSQTVQDFLRTNDAWTFSLQTTEKAILSLVPTIELVPAAAQKWIDKFGAVQASIEGLSAYMTQMATEGKLTAAVLDDIAVNTVKLTKAGGVADNQLRMNVILTGHWADGILSTNKQMLAFLNTLPKVKIAGKSVNDEFDEMISVLGIAETALRIVGTSGSKAMKEINDGVKGSISLFKELKGQTTTYSSSMQAGDTGNTTIFGGKPGSKMAGAAMLAGGVAGAYEGVQSHNYVGALASGAEAGAGVAMMASMSVAMGAATMGVGAAVVAAYIMIERAQNQMVKTRAEFATQTMQFASLADMNADLKGLGKAGQDLANIGENVIGKHDDAANAKWMKDVQAFYATIQKQVDSLATSTGFWSDQQQLVAAHTATTAEGLETIKDAILKQTQAGGTSIAHSLGIASDALDSRSSLTSQRDSIQSQLADASGSSADDLQKQLDTVQHQLDVVNKVYDATKIKSDATAKAVSSSLLGVVMAEVKSGTSFTDAIREAGPAITSLQKQLADTGHDGGAAFDFLAKSVAIVNDEVAGPALDSVQGYVDAMGNLANAGLMDQDTFAGLAETIGETATSLQSQGFTHGQVMAAMQSDLQKTWEMQQKYGYTVDDTTQAMIDEGLKSGEIGEQGKTDNEKILDVLVAIADALGAKIPEGLESMVTASSTAAGQMKKNVGTAASDMAKDVANQSAVASAAINGIGANVDPIHVPVVVDPTGGAEGPSTPPAQTHAGGGIIYAQSGAKILPFVPRGTDTVPAMLTPGERVLTVDQTKKYDANQSDGADLHITLVMPDGDVLLKQVVKARKRLG